MIVRNAYEIIRQERAEERIDISGLRIANANLFDNQWPKPKSLIEISGRPNSGKTILLQQLVAQCVLPTYFGGKYIHAIYIDCGHHFNIKRYMDIGRRLIRESQEPLYDGEDNVVVKKCFDSVKFYNCYDANALELAFDEIENLLWSGENRSISLLAIDQLDAFYWQGRQRIRMRTHYARLTERLKKICNNHNIVCAYCVSTNYIEAKGKTASGTITPSNVDYRLELKLFRNGKRTLNGKVITIRNDGIHMQQDTPST